MAESVVSVVVPVYNVEAYLSKCVDSICRQSYRDLEIILVDDGSTDRCPALCDRFAAEDSRITVIHKKNGGLSDARNAGIDRSTGEFITFVDSDDWVDPDFVGNILAAMRENQADIGIGDYVRTEGEKILTDSEEKENAKEKEKVGPGGTAQARIVTYSGREAIRGCYRSERHGMAFTAWGKIYRSDLFHSPIRFPVGKIHEDSFTTYRLLYCAVRVVYVDRVLYFYRTTEGSIMQKPFSLRRLDGLEAAEGAWRFFLSNEEDELTALAGNYYCRLYFQICYLLKRSGLYGAPEMKAFRRKMRADIAKCLSVCHVPLGKKIVYRLTACFPTDFILKRVMAE